MPADKVIFATFAILVHIGLNRQLDGFGRKGKRAGGWVKQGDIFIRQAIGHVEIGFENFMHRTHDVLYDRLWRVVNATLFAHAGVVLVQEGFVKVHDGVFALALLVVLVKDAVDIRHIEYRGDIINGDGNLFFRFSVGNVFKQITQDTSSMRDVFNGVFPGEFVLVACARGEHAIGDGLGVKVGEALGGSETGDEIAFKGLVVVVKVALFDGGDFFFKLIEDNIAQKAGSFGKLGGKAFGIKGFWQFEREESVCQAFKVINVLECWFGF